MTSYAISPAPQASIAIEGQPERFPIRRVYCVGRNYADHAREMGNDPDREPPFFFAKPADAVVPATGSIPYPPLTSDLHHEIELVVAIGTGGTDIDPAGALDHVWGYTVGVDLTRRDLQAIAKKMSRPWENSKGFDASAPAAPLMPAARIGHPAGGRIWISVNGQVRQQGDLADQIWAVPDIIAHLSRSVRLEPGDLIFTGTPAGVAALQPGDQVEGGIDGIGSFRFAIGPKAD